MTGQRPLNTGANRTISAAGTATITLGPNVGQRWRLFVAAVRTSTAILIPTCKIYMGSGAVNEQEFIDGTNDGNFDSTGKVGAFPLSAGQKITAFWEGGDIGALATLSLFGVEVS
jgi:hypothetical protein